MSNILKIFNPPESHDLGSKEVKNCLSCQIIATFSTISTGIWFTFNEYFNDKFLIKTKKIKNNSILFKNFIRTSGIFMIGYGVYRGTEGWLWYDKTIDINQD